jgi:ribosomal protein S18 acetylase RimI-like enzyme
MATVHDVTLVPLDPESPHFAGAVRLHAALWPPLAGEPSAGETQMRRHARYPGYAGMAALAPDGAVVGFSYGMTDEPGQWWHEHIAPVLGVEDTQRHLTGSFALTALGVDVAWQGLGVGTWLHNALLARVPHDRATLSTECDNTTARRLYKRLGWRVIVERMRFASPGPEWVIMARSLAR